MDHRVSKDMISSGMTPSGEKTQADLGKTQYGSAPSPNRLMDAYHSMYQNQKEETLEEGDGLYANIHAKRKRGGKMRKKGDKGAPSSQDFANAARTAKEEVEVDEAVSQSMRPSNMKKKAKLSAALDRLQALKVAKKKREMGEAFAETGMAKGSGKPSGVMKDFLDKRAKKLEKQRAAQPERYRNNPAFDSTSPDSRSTDLARTRREGVSFQQFQEKCWPGYEKKGMKTMFGKRYPNCVKKKK